MRSLKYFIVKKTTVKSDAISIIINTALKTAHNDWNIVTESGIVLLISKILKFKVSPPFYNSKKCCMCFYNIF